MRDMTPAIWIHLVAALLALGLTFVQLYRSKGTGPHKQLGWLWVVALLVTALSSFGIRESGGPWGFSWIHGLSVYTLVGVVAALVHIRGHRVRQHQLNMRYLSLGLIIAGLFTLLPGRRLGDFLWTGLF